MSVSPAMLRLSPGRESTEILARAAEVLRGGGLLIYPSETFYALGCDPRSEAAAARLMKAKGRPTGKPLPLLVGRRAHLPGVTTGLQPPFAALADRFWPGPLTLVLHASQGLASPVTAGTGTVAVRWTSWAAAQQLALAFGGALVATSANRAGAPPARTAEEAARSVGAEAVDLIVDGGATPGGLPSTIVDLTVAPPRVLREGAVPAAELAPYLRGQARTHPEGP